MTWDAGLLPDQSEAASHFGNHARLLAGPGTGKTLTMTRRVCFLVEERCIDPKEILAVTFTRAAARELRQRVAGKLGEGQIPRISTLHSFALRQLLRNASTITVLPQPLRIADDWEERHIILEDLKSMLGLATIKKTRGLLNDLSADWQSLTADKQEWEKHFPNPAFLGAWREHRRVYGYVLRSELVYQLKHALEAHGDFVLEGSIRHLLVDEYQDLNRCDLAVVREVISRDVELFVAGDDDQSIYGFRKAHPEGIRRFTTDYPGARELDLKVCMRCDPEILSFGLFVAEQDHEREPKEVAPEEGREGGEVRVLRFRNQDNEALAIAAICAHLIQQRDVAPGEILILLRSDHDGLLSTPIRQRLAEFKIPVAATTEDASPFNRDSGRTMLAMCRLAANRRDHLAWRSLFKTSCAGVGRGATDAVYTLAKNRGFGFAHAVLAAVEDPDLLTSMHRNRVTVAAQAVLDRLDSLFPEEPETEYETPEALLAVVRAAVDLLVLDGDERDAITSEFERVAEVAEATTLDELVRAVETTGEDIEQELADDKVSILTMHRAKGLTAKAVVVAAAEDEYIPGRATGDEIGDERRLLYVSLTRAKHHLFVTYCNRRTGSQRYTGSTSGKTARSLTQFLQDAPVRPVDGVPFIQGLLDEMS